MDDDRSQELPTARAGDFMHTGIKAALSAIPIVGGPATELFAALVAPPLSKRRDQWFSSLDADLRKLGEKFDSVRAEYLLQNEEFVTTLLNASQVAVRNHQQEKLTALRNAVLNAALPNSPDTDIQQMFLTYVESLTTTHLRVLHCATDPPGWCRKHGLMEPRNFPVRSVVKFAFKDLESQPGLLDLILKDLDNNGLAYVGNLHEGIQQIGDDLRVTPIGEQFLAFITSPIHDDQCGGS